MKVYELHTVLALGIQLSLRYSFDLRETLAILLGHYYRTLNLPYSKGATM